MYGQYSYQTLVLTTIYLLCNCYEILFDTGEQLFVFFYQHFENVIFVFRIFTMLTVILWYDNDLIFTWNDFLKSYSIYI